MREAKRAGIGKAIVLRALEAMLRHNFAGVHVHRFGPIPPTSEPVIFFSNHISVWDYPVGAVLTPRLYQRDPFAMTAAKTMFLGAEYAGCFSVDVENAVGSARSLRYAMSLVNRTPGCGLWMFPQGMILFDARSRIHFKPGLAQLVNFVRQGWLVPVTMRHTSGNHTKAEVYVQFGRALAIEELKHQPDLTGYLEQLARTQHSHLRLDLARMQTDHYQTVLRGFPDVRSLVLWLQGQPYPPLNVWGLWYEEGGSNTLEGTESAPQTSHKSPRSKS